MSRRRRGGFVGQSFRPLVSLGSLGGVLAGLCGRLSGSLAMSLGLGLFGRS
jgi:hypothetical protein